ncbi:hypothetical protein [Eleftheria terrae]|uniref:hypothetical protein n=1 Tax=Eleftheria terrae TaxID=1597781 RepID=UPI00263B2345|nr:hypothetical protein [Eleftheria terrae]WKB55608.1 hypothetical protein N7L95_26405 [Eleftheria terrae]
MQPTRPAARYRAELGVTMVLYAVVLTLAIVALRSWVTDDAALRAGIALAPMVPGGLVCWVALRQLRRIDELQRRVQFEAMAFAFAGTALLTFGYGFLQMVGFPSVPLLVVWPVMGLLWMVGVLLSARRYR